MENLSISLRQDSTMNIVVRLPPVSPSGIKLSRGDIKVRLPGMGKGITVGRPEVPPNDVKLRHDGLLDPDPSSEAMEAMYDPYGTCFQHVSR